MCEYSPNIETLIILSPEEHGVFPFTGMYAVQKHIATPFKLYSRESQVEN